MSWRSFAVLALVGSPLPGGERIDFAQVDLCSRIPGAEVAAAVGDTLAQARRFNDPDGVLARCTYFLKTAQGEDEVFSIEAFAAGDFDAVRPYVDQPIHDIDDIGDGAWAYRDPDANDRLRLYTRRRDVVTLDVTGDDEAEVRRVAALAISKF